MKLKYYLRGLAVGIIVTTVILAIVSGHSEKNMSDADVIARAKQLGMVMSNSQTIDKNNLFSTENTEDTEDSATTENSTQETQDENQQTEAGGTDGSAEQTGSDENTDNNAAEGQENTDAAQQQDPEQTQYVEVIIAPGEYCRAVSEDLANKGLVSDSESFRKYMFDAKYDELISSGVYQIPVGASYEEIGKILISGNN